MRLLPILLIPPALLAQAPDPTSLAWLEGTWLGEAGGIHQEETWSAPAHGHILGMFREVKEGRVHALELFTVHAEADGLWLLMRHFDGDLQPWAREKKAPLRWKAVVVEPGHLRLEQAEGGSLTYRREGNLMQVQLEVPRPDGTRFRNTYAFRRKTS